MGKRIWDGLKRAWRILRRGGRIARLIARIEEALRRLRNQLDAAKKLAKQYQAADDAVKARRALARAAIIEQDMRRLEQLKRLLEQGRATEREIEELIRILERYGL